MKLIHPRFCTLLILAAIAGILPKPARAQTTASLRGQITGSVSGLPLEGASVTLDLAPADQDFEFHVESGAFGFFKIESIPTGTYTLSISHPAYVSATPEMISFAPADRINRVATLTPLPGGPFFDITAEVSGAVAGIPLEGAPVKALRFSNAADSNPSNTLLGRTDANGLVTFRGMQAGFYRFSVNDPNDDLMNRPRWETFSTTTSPLDLSLIDKTHIARFLLKPKSQQVIIKVMGYDPVIEMNDSPLNGFFVELNGLHPDDPTREVIPTRVGVTEGGGSTKGEVRFSGLPAIPYRVTVKRLGYEPQTEIISPDAAGKLPGSDDPPTPTPHTVSVQAQATFLLVDIVDDFTDELYWVNAPVRLQGIKGSNTEGIDRTSGFSFDFSVQNGPALWDKRHYFGLLPGKYRLSFEGMVEGDVYHVTPNQPRQDRRPWFRFNTIVDVPGIDQSAIDVAAHPHVEVFAEAEPAIVRGRLFAADEFGDIELFHNADGSLIYRPKPQAAPPTPQITIQLIEYAEDELIEVDRRTVTVEVDSTGAFSLPVLPGRYGIAIANLEDYWGSHVALQDIGDGVIHEQGWPFHQLWPHSSRPPKNGTLNDGEPLILRSQREYNLDIFVRRKTVDIQGEADSDPADPVRRLIIGDGFFGTGYNDIAVTGGMATLTGPTSGASSVPLVVRSAAIESQMTYRLANVEPGSHTISVSHSRNTFSYDDGPNSVSIEVPEWPSPGVLPTIDPQTSSEPQPMTIVRIPDVFQASYISGNTSIEVTFFNWQQTGIDDNDEPIYGYLQGNTITSLALIIKPSYAPGLSFIGQNQLPNASFDFTFQVGGTPPKQFTATASPGANFYNVRTRNPGTPAPNPPANVVDATPAGTPYTLIFKSVSSDDPTLLVPGTTATFGSGMDAQVIAGNTITPDLSGNFSPSSVANASWVLFGGSYRIVSFSPLTIEVTRTFNRGLAVSGTVAANGPSAAAPITNAVVRVLDRYGVTISQLNTTNVAGAFALPNAIPRAQTVYVDVTAPGFIPWRGRFSGADFMDVGMGDLQLTIDAMLDPMPAPTVQAVAVDRFGLFLPGINKSGNAMPGAYLTATDELTMTWTLMATAGMYTYNLPPFDNADGAAPASSSRQAADPIAEVWLIDPRSFATNPFTDAPMPLTPPAPGDFDELREWLKAIQRGDPPNVFHQRVMIQQRPPDGVIEASGQIELWKLPPGAFKPIFVIVSQQGATAVYTDFQYESPTHELTGAAIPPWMAFAADTISTISSAQTTAAQVKNFMPEGRFTPLPAFTGVITNDSAHFIHYHYSMMAEWTEGLKTPGSGLLAFAPGILGINFDASVNFGSDGSMGQLFLDANSLVMTDPAPIKNSFIPKIIRDKVPAPEFEIEVNAGSEFEEFLDTSDSPNEMRLTTTVTSDFDVTFKDLPVDKAIAKASPAVGAVLLALEKSIDFKLKGQLGGGIGLRSESAWLTPFPPSRSPNTSDPELDHVLARDSFGQVMNSSFQLGLRFNAGLDLTAGPAGGSVTIRLTGNPDAKGKPSLLITPNALGDWPPISRIQGSLVADIKVNLDAWIVEFDKAWSIELVPIDKQFGTTSEYYLVPINITLSRRSPASSAPSTFQGSGNLLIENFLRGGFLTTARNGADALVFTDVDAMSGTMLLKAALRNGDNPFAAPVTIASAGGILNSTISPLPGGGWIAVWTQIDAADVGNPFPTSAIMSSVSADGTTWSTPALAAALPDVASELRLVVNSATVGLTFLETADGPMATSFTLKTTTWDGAQWSAPAPLLTDATIATFDATGCGVEAAGPGVIVYSDGAGNLSAFIWDGPTPSSPTIIASNAGNSFSVRANKDDEYYLAYEQTGQGIGLLRYDGMNGWVDLGIAVAGATPSEIKITPLEDTGVTLYLISWIQGGDVTAIWRAYVDGAGASISPPVNVTANLTGRHGNLQILPRAEHTAKAIAVYLDAGQASVVELSLSPGSIQPRLMSPAFTGDGAFQFNLMGNPGQNYRIQSSLDLITWNDRANLSPRTPLILYSEPDAANLPPRFYRGITP